MDYETEEAQIIADRGWWQALLPGAKLVGWSGRDSATFRDEKTRDVFHIPGIAAHYIAAAIREAVERNGCPFCGDTHFQQIVVAPHTGGRELQTLCGMCYARGPAAKTHEEADNLWKRRALSGEK